MNRVLVCLASVLICAGATLCVGNRVSAQQSDSDTVKARSDAFHAALGTLDIGKVEEIWAHDANVITINRRDKAVSVGWDAVRQSYKATFDFWSELIVTQKDELHIRVNGSVAWTAGITTATGKTKTGNTIADAQNFENCVLEKRNGRWVLVSRSVWRVPQ